MYITATVHVCVHVHVFKIGRTVIVPAGARIIKKRFITSLTLKYCT